METKIANIQETKSFAALHAGNAKVKAGLTAAFVICFLSTLFSGIVSMLMSVYLPVAVKDLLGTVTEEKMNDVSAWINALFIFGWMFGGFTWGYICDRIGRSRSVILSVTCYGLFAVLTGLASSWSLVSMCRFLSGFGIGGVLVTTTILVAELWSDKKRAVVMGIVSVAMPVGFFVAGAINNFMADWRSAFWTGIIPLALAIIAIFILPESEKWKTDKQNPAIKESTNKQVFAPEHRKNLVTGSVLFGAMLIGLWAIFSWAPTWVQSISTSADVQQQRGSTMMILAGGGIIGSFCSGWIVNAIGLRKTMLMCFAACFIMTFVVFKLNTDVSIATFAEMAVLVFFFGISQGALSIYIPALFPTGIRASATGFCFNVGRLFTGTVVFFIGALVVLLGGYGNAVFTFSFTFLAGFVATLFSKDVKDGNSLG
ncbi:MAG TPA: MFS transporter [Panacibacter sp.]|nr:MFS transporter [Panacibacter sp.]